MRVAKILYIKPSGSECLQDRYRWFKPISRLSWTSPETRCRSCSRSSHSSTAMGTSYTRRGTSSSWMIRTHVRILPRWRSHYLIIRRWQAQCGSDLDRMLRAACRNSLVAMGCGRAGRCRPRWRGSSQVYEPDRRLDQDGRINSLCLLRLFTDQFADRIATNPLRERTTLTKCTQHLHSWQKSLPLPLQLPPLLDSVDRGYPARNV